MDATSRIAVVLNNDITTLIRTDLLSGIRCTVQNGQLSVSLNCHDGAILAR